MCECGGINACHSMCPNAVPESMICGHCGKIVYYGDTFYRSTETGEIVGCENCIESEEYEGEEC